MLHDPGGTLGAEHALVHGMIAVAFDIADHRRAVRTLADVDIDAAATGTHVTGGFAHLVRDMWARIDLRL